VRPKANLPPPPEDADNEPQKSPHLADSPIPGRLVETETPSSHVSAKEALLIGLKKLFMIQPARTPNPVPIPRFCTQCSQLINANVQSLGSSTEATERKVEVNSSDTDCALCRMIQECLGDGPDADLAKRLSGLRLKRNSNSHAQLQFGRLEGKYRQVYKEDRADRFQDSRMRSSETVQAWMIKPLALRPPFR